MCAPITMVHVNTTDMTIWFIPVRSKHVDLTGISMFIKGITVPV